MYFIQVAIVLFRAEVMVMINPHNLHLMDFLESPEIQGAGT